MVSLETWAGALYYALFFPVAGAILDASGLVGGYGWIAAAIATTAIPLVVVARVRGL
jgi:hypothetical protein